VFFDFNTGIPTDARNKISVPPGTKLGVTLQWDDAFYDSSNVDTDLDLLCVFSGTDTTLFTTSGIRDNIGTGYPSEFMLLDISASGSTLNVDLLVRHKAGSFPTRVYLRYNNDPVTAEYDGYPSIHGHNGAASVITVAAADFANQRVSESFTSHGPVTLLFNPNGTPLPALVTLDKPDITATDKTNTTFFGTDLTDPDSLPNFAGTSAAAPHVAGVVALLLQKSPNLTPSEVANQLRFSAVDIGQAGVDNVTGYGLVDAYELLYDHSQVANFSVGSPYSMDFETGIDSNWTLTRSRFQAVLRRASEAGTTNCSTFC
jgi:hypothetical protein